MTQNARARRYLALVVLGAIWGSTWMATEALAEYVPSLCGEGARCLVAALALSPLLLAKRAVLPRGRALDMVLLLSATMICLPAMLAYWSRQYTSSVTVTVLFAAMPFLLALQVTTPRAAMQAALVGLGALALVLNAYIPLGQAAGAAIALAAVISAGFSALLVGRELRNENPVSVTFVMLGAGGLVLLLASLVLERGQSIGWNLAALPPLAFLALVGGAPAYVLYIWLLQRMEAYKVSTVQWISILIALAEASLYLHIPWSARMIAGLVVALISLWVILRVHSDDDDTVSLLPIPSGEGKGMR
jgi:drug/metabolite transporter (DMT)-like permease